MIFTDLGDLLLPVQYNIFFKNLTLNFTLKNMVSRINDSN